MSSGPGRSTNKRWIAAAATAGAGVAALAAWVAQHRAVGRAAQEAQRTTEDEGLSLPGDLLHHDIVTDDGGSIRVVERGQGPTLLLLHGIMLSSELWVHQLTDLASRHRVVAVDLRGHGRSVPGRAGFRAHGERRDPDTLGEAAPMALAGEGAPALARLADDVRTVIDALDLRDCLLVGHSMGGMVALQLLHQMSEAERRLRFRGAALVSTSAAPAITAPGWSRLVKLTAPMSSRAVLLAERAGASRLPVEDLRWWLTRLGFGPEPVAAQVRFVERLHQSTPRGTLAQLVPSLALFDLSAGLHDIDLPVLVVVGSRDRLTGPGHARRLAASLARAELVELARCGHMPMLERRHEFSRLLEEFCAKVA
ncbi:MAG TPA: alpha/beta hydrolase [Acidimicrobiales bacterium]|nr:alpha/beta hydrolase [Acidimicrobiales bacterium]